MRLYVFVPKIETLEYLSIVQQNIVELRWQPTIVYIHSDWTQKMSNFLWKVAIFWQRLTCADMVWVLWPDHISSYLLGSGQCWFSLGRSTYPESIFCTCIVGIKRFQKKKKNYDGQLSPRVSLPPLPSVLTVIIGQRSASLGLKLDLDPGLQPIRIIIMFY